MLSYYRITLYTAFFILIPLIISSTLEKNLKIQNLSPYNTDAIGSPDYEINFESLKNENFSFEIIPSPIHRYQLFDIGITDINQDGLLDLFTSNCNFKPSFLINQRNFNFRNDTSSLKLDLLPEFPGFACSSTPPTISNPGLYIYYIWEKITFKYIKLPQIEKANAKLIIPHTLISVHPKSENKTIIKKIDTFSEVSLTLEDKDLLQIDVAVPAIPIDFQIDTTIPLQNIFIGSDKVHPSNHNFSLNTIDRHSYAWADINKDGAIDLFIGRGSLRGYKEFEYIRKNMLQNQLFLNHLSSDKTPQFENVYPLSGLTNCECGTRKASWVDIDNDNTYELFIICTRNEPCHLFKKFNDKYKECASDYKLNINGEVPYFWFDFNDDGFLDLLTFFEKKLTIYENLNGTEFNQHLLDIPKDNIAPTFLLANDLDHDQHLEFLFADINSHKTYLIKHLSQFHFEQLNPEDLGLPNTSYWCAWADLNNDSHDELISIPNGIYKKSNSPNTLKYEKCNLLQLPNLNPENFSDARVETFDADNDGNLDIIIGYREKSPTNLTGYGEWWHLSLLKNTTPSGNWIQIDSTFPVFNSTIGFGTTITIQTQNNKKITRVLGQFENSRAHQGHYRIYFGLGTDQPSKLIIQKNKYQIITCDLSETNKLYSLNQLLNSKPTILTPTPNNGI